MKEELDIATLRSLSDLSEILGILHRVNCKPLTIWRSSIYPSLVRKYIESGPLVRSLRDKLVFEYRMGIFGLLDLYAL